MVFKKIKIDWNFELHQIKLRLGFWMKGWEPECPYSPSDLVINLEGVTSWKKVGKTKICLPWQPPPLKFWKWNVDGSAIGKPGLAGIGGVLRDDKGNILAKFSASIGIKDSNEAEFNAIDFALEISMDKEWLKSGRLIVESDSKNALAWVKASGPWHLRFLSNKLRNILEIMKNVTFTHKSRESNHLADKLAKEGVYLKGSWVKWYEDACSG